MSNHKRNLFFNVIAVPLDRKSRFWTFVKHRIHRLPIDFVVFCPVESYITVCKG
jgi:hypothetical protein